MYYASKGGGYGRVDHRIVKAEKITERYSRKLMNCLARLTREAPFEIGGVLSSADKLKRYGLYERKMLWELSLDGMRRHLRQWMVLQKRL